ncbi:MAG: recombination factor protein RarA, partial [bacterium]
MTTDSLFSSEPAYQPLAARMRPKTLAEYVGQQHLLGKDAQEKGKPLRDALESGAIHSMILW